MCGGTNCSECGVAKQHWLATGCLVAGCPGGHGRVDDHTMPNDDNGPGWNLGADGVPWRVDPRTGEVVEAPWRTTLRRVSKPRMVMRSLRVPEKLWEAAKAKADEREENLSDVIRLALSVYAAGVTVNATDFLDEPLDAKVWVTPSEREAGK